MFQKCLRRFAISGITSNMQSGGDQDQQQAKSAGQNTSEKQNSPERDLSEQNLSEQKPSKDQITWGDSNDSDPWEGEWEPAQGRGRDEQLPPAFKQPQNQNRDQHQHSQYQEHNSGANISQTPNFGFIPLDQIAFSAEFLDHDELARLIDDFITQIVDDREHRLDLKVRISTESDSEPSHSSPNQNHAWSASSGRREDMVTDYYNTVERIRNKEDRLRILTSVYQKHHNRNVLRSYGFEFESDEQPMRKFGRDEDISEGLYSDDENDNAEEHLIEDSHEFSERKEDEDLYSGGTATLTPRALAEGILPEASPPALTHPEASPTNQDDAVDEDVDEAAEDLHSLVIEGSAQTEIRRDTTTDDTSATTEKATTDEKEDTVNNDVKVEAHKEGKFEDNDDTRGSVVGGDHSTGTASWFPIISASIDPASPFPLPTPKIHVSEYIDIDSEPTSTQTSDPSKGKTPDRKNE